MPVTIRQLTERGARRRWFRRLAVVASALVAGYHIVSTRAIVDPIAGSSLAAEPRDVAIVLWHFGSVILVSIPVALAWSYRVDEERGRPLQAYVAVLVGGLAVVFAAVALNTYGASGLLVLPQWLFGLVILAFIVGGMTADRDRSFNLPAKHVPVAPESSGVAPR